MTSPETYKKVADRYMKRFTHLTRDNSLSNFRDIASNILSGVYGYAQLMDRPGKITSRYRNKFLRSLRIIRNYYSLLNKHPEFRQGELTRKGAFPDLIRFVESKEGVRQAKEVGINGFQSYYVYLAKQRLEGKLATS